MAISLHMDSVVRKVNEMVYSRGLKLSRDCESWELSQLLLTHDTALFADAEVKLHHLVTEFDRVCDRRKQWVYVDEIKIMKFMRRT